MPRETTQQRRQRRETAKWLAADRARAARLRRKLYENESVDVYKFLFISMAKDINDPDLIERLCRKYGWKR